MGDYRKETHQSASNLYACAVLKKDGTVVAWGQSAYGGTVPAGLTGVKSLFSTSSAFAALKTDGTVVCWGMYDLGGTVPAGLSDVKTIYSNNGAFAALKTDGSVVCWGIDFCGGTAKRFAKGEASGEDVTSSLTNSNNPVIDIYSTRLTFLAIRMNGAVLWGLFNHSLDLHVPNYYLNGTASTDPIVYNKPVIHIATSLENGYTGIFEDGTIGIWGTDGKTNSETTTLLSNINTTNWTVVDVVASSESFVVLTSTGKLFGWGDTDEIEYIPTTSDFKAIFSNKGSYVGLKTNNEVVAWGKAFYGGTIPGSLGTMYATAVYATAYAFAVVTTTGGVKSWGSGGIGDSFVGAGTGTTYDIYQTFISPPSSLTNPQKIFTTQTTFIAETENGEIVAWGGKGYEINSSTDYLYDLTNPPPGIGSIKDITSAVSSIIALKEDDSIVSWGSPVYAGVCPAVLKDVKSLPLSKYSGLFINSSSIIPPFVIWGVTGLLKVTNLVPNSYVTYSIDNGVTWTTVDIDSPEVTKEIQLPFGGASSTTTTYLASSVQFMTVSTKNPLKNEVRSKIVSNPYSIISRQRLPTYKCQINTGATAVLKYTGSVVLWGAEYSGGQNSPAITDKATTLKLMRGVVEIYPFDIGFIVLKEDGTLVGWAYGGDIRANIPNGLTGVINIYTNANQVFALKNDMTFTVWGDNGYGGTTYDGVTIPWQNPFGNYVGTAGTISMPSSIVSGGSAPVFVKNIYVSRFFAALLTNENKLYAWGIKFGNNKHIDFQADSGQDYMSNVKSVFYNDYAMAALRTDGTVLAWGNKDYGGDLSSFQGGLTNVEHIFTNPFSMIALKTDKTIVGWGYASHGATVPTDGTATNIIHITSNNSAYAALKSDGSIISWGLIAVNPPSGMGSTDMAVQLQSTFSSSVQNNNFVAIYATYSAFAALRSNGMVIAWGQYGNGAGYYDGYINGYNQPPVLTNIVTIRSTGYGFAALRSDGNVFDWGSTTTWGWPDAPAYSAITPTTLSGTPGSSFVDTGFDSIVDIYTNTESYTAIKSNGAVITWGRNYPTSDSTPIQRNASDTNVYMGYASFYDTPDVYLYNLFRIVSVPQYTSFNRGQHNVQDILAPDITYDTPTNPIIEIKSVSPVTKYINYSDDYGASWTSASWFAINNSYFPQSVPQILTSYPYGKFQVRTFNPNRFTQESLVYANPTVFYKYPPSVSLSYSSSTKKVTVSDLYSAYEYSLDGGKTWTTRTQAQNDFIVTPGRYVNGDIQVRSFMNGTYQNGPTIITETIEIAPNAPNVVWGHNGEVFVTTTQSGVSSWVFSVDGTNWETVRGFGKLQLPYGTYSSFNVLIKAYEKSLYSPLVYNFEVVTSNPTKIHPWNTRTNRFGYQVINADKTISVIGGVGSTNNGPASIPTNLKTSSTANGSYIVTTNTASSVICDDKTVKSWGEYTDGSNAITTNFTKDLVNIKNVYSNETAFAAIDTSSTLHVWGDPSGGGRYPYGLNSTSVSSVSNVNINSMYATNRAFTGVSSDNKSLTIWGSGDNGGSTTRGSTRDTFRIRKDALDSNGNIEYLGDIDATNQNAVGNSATYRVAYTTDINKAFIFYMGDSIRSDGKKVIKLADYVTDRYILRNFNGLITARYEGVDWNSTYDNEWPVSQLVAYPNGTSKFDLLNTTTFLDDLGTSHRLDIVFKQTPIFEAEEWVQIPTILTDLNSYGRTIKTIYTTTSAFAAHLDNDTVAVWGTLDSGGDLKKSGDGSGSTAMKYNLTGTIANIAKVVSAYSGFAFLSNDGIVTSCGTYFDQNWNKLKFTTPSSLRVSGSTDDIVATDSCFIALKSDNTVVLWGDPGIITEFNKISPPSNVYSIATSRTAVALLTTGGEVYTFGFYYSSNNVKILLSTPPGLTNVKRVYTTDSAFAALTHSGEVVVWGNPFSGGSSINDNFMSSSSSYRDGYQGKENSLKNVIDIVPSVNAFLAIKSDNTVSVWGNTLMGGSLVQNSGNNKTYLSDTNKYAFVTSGTNFYRSGFLINPVLPITNITINSSTGKLDVTLLQRQYRLWEYSFNTGTTWGQKILGVTSVNIPAGKYNSGKIQVRGEDMNGVSSPSSYNSSYVQVDPGTPNIDFTGAPKILISNFGSPAGSLWQYTINAGTNWITVSPDTSFNLIPGNYQTSNFKVRTATVDGLYSQNVTAPSDIIIKPNKPTAIFDDVTFRYYITIAPFTVNWRYTTNSETTWSQVFEPVNNNYIQVDYGRYDSDDIRVQNGTPDNLFSESLILSSVLERPPETPVMSTIINNTITVTNLQGGDKWQYSVDFGTSWQDKTFADNTFSLTVGRYPAQKIQVRVVNTNETPDLFSTTVMNSVEFISPPGKPSFDYNDSAKIIITSYGTPSAPNWAYSIDSGVNWTQVVGSNNFTIPTYGMYNDTNFFIKVYTNDNIDSLYASFPPGFTYIYGPPPPTVSYNVETFTFTIQTLGAGSTTWSYLLDNVISSWSPDFTLANKNTLLLPFGTYEAGEILFRNKLSDGTPSRDRIGGNTKIIRRPGYPKVKFNSSTGIITLEKFGDGAILWRYSIDGGSSWSHDILKIGDIAIPPGVYPPGSINVLNYTDDYTTTSSPVPNPDKIIVPEINYDAIAEQISGFYPLQYPEQWDPEPEDDPQLMVDFPSYINNELRVSPRGSYVSWEYSAGVDVRKLTRVWIKPDKDVNSVKIPPGYYNGYMISVKLHRSNGTYTIVFNTRDIEIYPEPPILNYIGDGLISVYTLDNVTSWQYTLQNITEYPITNTGSILRLPVGKYLPGGIRIRSVIDGDYTITSAYIHNDSEIIVEEQNYNNSNIKDDWIVDTVIKTPAKRGHTEINVVTSVGFGLKKAIVIGYGNNSEINVVSGYGSLILSNPLQNNYPEGTIVRGYDFTISNALTEEEKERIKKEQDFIYNNFYPKFSKSRLQGKCYKPIIDPENTTIETCEQSKPSVWIFGDKSFSGADSKINRIKSKILRGGNGKIVYGENGLSSPFLPADTNENTDVSKYYRCNRPNNVPIINGLRGGVVPVKMRTNKF